MQNSTHKHLLLNRKVINNTNSSVNIATQCYKSPTSNQYYVVSTIKPNRPASPNIHLKTKIRLVSPQRHLNTKAVLPKENNPPREVEATFYQPIRNTSEIEIKSRTPKAIILQKLQTDQSNTMQIINHHQHKTENVNSSMTISLQHPNQFFQPKKQNTNIHVFRSVSPQRVFFNNKIFNIGNIKQKIIYVNPKLQKIDQKTVEITQPMKESINLTTIQREENEEFTDNLVFPQNNNIQSIREQYDVNIKEIQQLQSEIQQNSQEIKHLLENSRVSKNSSKRNSEGRQQSKKQINLQNAHTNYINPHSQSNLSIKKDNLDNKNTNECVKTHDRTPNIDEKKETICSHQTLINELDFTTRHRDNKNHQTIKKGKDEASVQTDSNDNSITHESTSTKTDSKFNKLTLTQNIEYSIKIQNSIFLKLQIQENNTIAVPSSTRLKHSVASNKKEQKKDLHLCLQPSLDFLLKNQTNRSQKNQETVIKQQIIQKSNSSIQSNKTNNKQQLNHKSIKEVEEKKQQKKDQISVVKMTKELKISKGYVKTQKEIKTDNISRTQGQKKNQTTIINLIQTTKIVPTQVQTSLPSSKEKQRRFTNKMYL